MESCEVYRQIAGSQLSKEELAGKAGGKNPAGNGQMKGFAGDEEKEAFGHA